MEKSLLVGLEKEVREYFLKNIHKGFLRDFQFMRIDFTPGQNFRALDEKLVWAVPHLIFHEIEGRDENWERGLEEIGKKYEINLCLPYWCYKKD